MIWLCRTAMTVLVALSLGCAWPSREESWCLPKAKYKRDRHELYAGVRCDFQ